MWEGTEGSRAAVGRSPRVTTTVHRHAQQQHTEATGACTTSRGGRYRSSGGRRLYVLHPAADSTQRRSRACQLQCSLGIPARGGADGWSARHRDQRNQHDISPPYSYIFHPSPPYYTPHRAHTAKHSTLQGGGQQVWEYVLALLQPHPYHGGNNGR